MFFPFIPKFCLDFVNFGAQLVLERLTEKFWHLTLPNVARGLSSALKN
jgi:hypothetical protein